MKSMLTIGAVVLVIARHPQQSRCTRSPIRNQADGADARVLPALVEWHQRAREPAANRYNWLL